MVRVSFKAGDTVFLEREPGDALYVVDSGRVRIWVRDSEHNEVTLSELKAGDFFGEMSVLDGGKRSANATALNRCDTSVSTTRTIRVIPARTSPSRS